MSCGINMTCLSIRTTATLGNEVMHSIMDLSRPLKVVLTTLDEGRISGLGNSEKEIIYPFLRELNDLTEKIMSATNELQTHKTTI